MTRAAALFEAPTINESRMPDYELIHVTGVQVPVGTLAAEARR
jgi:hypothetical protein